MAKKKSSPKNQAPKQESISAETYFPEAAVAETVNRIEAEHIKTKKLCIKDLKESCIGTSSLIKSYIAQLSAEGVHTSNLEGAVRVIEREAKKLKATVKQY